MAQKEIRVGDVGSALRGTVRDQDGDAVNISQASSLYLSFLKPDETVITRLPVMPNGGSDGLIQYIWVTGDLDLAGLWRVQVSCTIPSQTLKSDWKAFRVHPNL